MQWVANKISRAVRRGGFRRGGRHSERPIGFDSRTSFFNFLRRHTKTAKNSYLCTTQRHRPTRRNRPVRRRTGRFRRVGRCRCVVQRYEFLAVFVCRRKKLKNDVRESKPIGRSECLPPRRNPPRRTARLILFATHCICPCLSVIFAFAQILPLGNVQINLTLHTLIRIFDCVLDTSPRKKYKRACFFLSAYSYLCSNK